MVSIAHPDVVTERDGWITHTGNPVTERRTRGHLFALRRFG